MEQPLIPFDLVRMIVGEAPVWFLAEIVLRTIVIYAYTLTLLRWVGGRSIAQLSVVEFLLVIALGSAVGDSMFYPEVPLLHAMTVVTVVVVIDKAIDVLSRRFNKAKSLISGSPIEVVRDGCILTDGLLNRGLGALELMEMLRTAGISNLGQVSHAYLEASGQISVFRADPTLPGLPILPPHELESLPLPGPTEQACCVQCGALTMANAQIGAPCANCDCKGRTSARLANGKPQTMVPA